MASFYQALNEEKRQVRFLRTIRFDGTSNERSDRASILSCEIKVFSLKHEPRYKASSYCWGQEEASITIKINNQPFMIPPNLYNFLRRYHDVKLQDQMSDDHNWIFVDAVCINQQDLDERSSQVKIMGDIYRGAMEVIAWLGVEGDLEREPLQGYKMEFFEFHQDPYSWQDLLDGLQIDLALLATTHLCGYETNLTMSPNLDEFERKHGKYAVRSLVFPFICRALWRRLWVPQEIILGTTLTIWYKTLRVSHDVLYECIRYWELEFDYKAMGILEMIPNWTNYHRTLVLGFQTFVHLDLRIG